MKEATGELNMTVITVVAVAAVAAFFYAFVWPAIRNSILSTQACNNGPGTIVGAAGTNDYVNCGAANTDGSYTCQYGKDNKTVTCTAKNQGTT